MFSDKCCEIKCVFPYVVGIRIMTLHISCDMYLRLGLHVQFRLYYVLPYKAKISAQHRIGFILDRCIVYLGLTMPNFQKKRLPIFEIFNIEKCTLFWGDRVYYRFDFGLYLSTILKGIRCFFLQDFVSLKVTQLLCYLKHFLKVENSAEQDLQRVGE